MIHLFLFFSINKKKQREIGPILYTTDKNEYQRHRGNCCAVFQGLVIIGDYENGKLYQLDKLNYTDDGQNVRRLRRAPHLVTEFQRQYFDELQIQFQPGVGTTGLSAPFGRYIQNPYYIPPDGTLTIGPLDTVFLSDLATINQNTPTTFPQAMLRWSSDGGSPWSNEHWTKLGKIGQYGRRAFWRRLGMTMKLRDRVYEVSGTDPVRIYIMGAELAISGTSA